MYFLCIVVFLPVCRTAVQADIVFLLDGSSGVGKSSFFEIQDFISSIVSYFPEHAVGPEGVRFGVTVFGDIPRFVKHEGRAKRRIIPKNTEFHRLWDVCLIGLVLWNMFEV